MKKTLEFIRQMKKEKVIKDYAISNDIGTIFYTEPFFCQHLDILFIPDDKKSLYGYLKSKGYEPNEDHVWIEGVAVRFNPVSNRLLEEVAVVTANRKRYRDTTVRVCKPEYLIAMFVNRDATWDRTKVSLLQEQTKINEQELYNLLKVHELFDKYINKFAD